MYNGTFHPEVIKACKAANTKLSRAQLAISLAYERSQGSSSRFYHFINTLPTQVTNYVVWPAVLLRIMDLAMPGARGYLANELREMKEANKYLKQPLPDESLIWAIGIVQTRAFGGHDSVEMLLPAASCFNHAWDKSKAVPMPTCSLKRRKCVLRNGKSHINRGEQMFFHYRSLSNLQLLIRYGFAATGNEWGPVVAFSPLESLPQWLRSAGCEGERIQLRGKSRSTGIPFGELSFRCALAAAMVNQSESRASEVEHLWSSGGFMGNMTGVVPSTVYRSIAQVCRNDLLRWESPEAIEAITNAAHYPRAPASDVVNALGHELELLQRCTIELNRLAEEADAISQRDSNILAS